MAKKIPAFLRQQVKAIREEQQAADLQRQEQEQIEQQQREHWLNVRDMLWAIATLLPAAGETDEQTAIRWCQWMHEATRDAAAMEAYQVIRAKQDVTGVRLLALKLVSAAVDGEPDAAGRQLNYAADAVGSDAQADLVLYLKGLWRAVHDHYVSPPVLADETKTELRVSIPSLGDDSDSSIVEYLIVGGQAKNELKLSGLLGKLKNAIRTKDSPPADEPSEPEKPIWDADAGELRLHGRTIKTVTNLGQARNVVAILNSFEEEGWPTRIDDPIPGGKNQERLSQAIKSLNRSLSAIKFRGDSSGAGIRWQRSE